MDVCYHGVHPSVLLRLIKWARKCSIGVIVQMFTLDMNGLDAIELAISRGHGALASCLLDHYDPKSYNDSLCNHFPLEVLELAIESRNEQCVVEVLANKRVMQHLQPGMTKRLNLMIRWVQRQMSKKRLFNVFTCVGAAVRCNMLKIVEFISKINPQETHQAVWYAVCKLKSQTPITVSIPPTLHRMAKSYQLQKLWPQLSVIVLLRSYTLLTGNEPAGSLWQRTRRFWRHRDWDVVASHTWTTLPNDIFSHILSFLLPSEMLEVKKMTFLVEY